MSIPVVSTNATTAAVPTSDRSSFLANIKSQVESVFSIESLAQYPMLVSNMNDNGYCNPAPDQFLL